MVCLYTTLLLFCRNQKWGLEATRPWGWRGTGPVFTWPPKYGVYIHYACRGLQDFKWGLEPARSCGWRGTGTFWILKIKIWGLVAVYGWRGTLIEFIYICAIRHGTGQCGLYFSRKMSFGWNDDDDHDDDVLLEWDPFFDGFSISYYAEVKPSDKIAVSFQDQAGKGSSLSFIYIESGTYRCCVKEKTSRIWNQF